MRDRRGATAAPLRRWKAATRRLFVVVVLVTMGVTGGGAADRLVTPIAWWQPTDPDALVRQGRSLMMARKHDEAGRLYVMRSESARSHSTPHGRSAFCSI